MSCYYTNFQETGDILIERFVGGANGFRQRRSATLLAPPVIVDVGGGGGGGGGGSGGSGAMASLHSGNWPELARNSCLNRLGGNGCWVRHCACDDCRPRVRRNSNISGCDGDLEPMIVTDEQMQMSYEILGLRPNELPIKGTFVDPRIIPGFKYTVCYLDGPEKERTKAQRLVFPEPVRLLSVGAGYGKRLVFDTKQLKGKHTGHFWSDNCPDGYALSLAPLDVGQRFSLRTRGGSQELGRVTITWVAPEPAECSVKQDASCVTVRVPVAFRATVSLTACRCLLGCHDYEDIPLTGMAWLWRATGSRSVAMVTKVDGVRLPDMPDLTLVPAEEK